MQTREICKKTERQNMNSYKPPLEDFNFILHHFLKIEKENIRGYEDLLPEFTKTIFEEAGKLASEVISPSNKDGDEQGCILENGIVRTPDSFKLAFDQLRACLLYTSPSPRD